MRILHLTHTSIPGDSRILRELGALSQLPDVSLFGIGIPTTPGPSTSRDLQDIRLVEPPLRSSRWRRLPSTIRHTLVLAEMTLRFAQGARRLRPDVIHCHDMIVLPAALIAKLFTSSVLIYDAHELESEKSGLSRAMSRAVRTLEKIAWPHIEGLITVSPAIQDWYATVIGQKPGVCILNSPELPAAPALTSGRPRPTLRSSLGIDIQDRLLVYVGGLERGRGIEWILASTSDWSEGVHVCFLGSGSLWATIETAKAQDPRIHLHRPVPHNELVAFLGDADAAFCLIEDVSLSDRYCLPNKLFECAFAGLPVVASRLPAIAEVVGEYDLGVCCDPEEGSLVEAIDKCLEMDAPDRKSLYSLSWEFQAERLRNFYEQVASPGPTYSASREMSKEHAGHR